MPPRLSLRIFFAANQPLGRGKIELLEHIRSEGSISAAGKAMGLSYRRAWMLADALNHMFEQPVIASKRGGDQGGGASLTSYGEDVLNRFRSMEAKTAAAVADDLQWFEAAYREPSAAEEAGPA